ncbi:exopolyphosphatase [Bacillus phage W.Ph.]|uniref:Gp111 n=1 Tax=Bacillus phage W.Ph. TaxID=764595 RepID=G9B1L2_9CAUD|nr:exopolyphosphatase [Bacillus phage W.Ph.]ADH03257.1 gp111 [Bacillus phage W.Ph.]
MDKELVKLYMKDNFMNTITLPVIKRMLPDYEIDVEFVNKIDVNALGTQARLVSKIIVVGLPIYDNDEFKQAIEPLNNPFSDFIHVNTYGRKVSVGRSVVSSDFPPIVFLRTLLLTNEMTTFQNVKDTSKNDMNVIHASIKYQQWKDVDTNNNIKILMALYRAFGRNITSVLKDKPLQEIMKANLPVIKSQLKQQSDFVEKKRQQTKWMMIDIDGTPVQVGTVYAEDWTNEVAHRNLKDIGSENGVALVASTTRTSDMVQVRTKGVTVEQFFAAANIKEGTTGSGFVGTMFLPTGTANVIAGAIKAMAESGE